mmetsp:Transcript_50330/g.98455  ORF Transcript_50330/g.98455 Transcript_50330/m.98455 type:complete len:466 (-) Transcript_50330:140-1537(-)
MLVPPPFDLPWPGWSVWCRPRGQEEEEEEEEEEQGTIVTRSGKMAVLAKVLPLWQRQGHRVLIFTQTRKMLNLIQRFTIFSGMKFGRIDGNTGIKDRQKVVDLFNYDLSYFGLLLTTKTGGVGLNLTGANRIILFDPDWNPQTDAQARERAYRFGQKKAVTIYRLITAGTIEEKIYHRQIFKTALTNQVLQDPRQRRLFNSKDLKDLFTLQPDTPSIKEGGDGYTQTGNIVRGTGVVHPSIAPDSNESGYNKDSHAKQDNSETINAILRGKGLAGIFDHGAVDGDVGNTRIDREMAEAAKKVASKAACALRESISRERTGSEFVPTWTGTSSTGRSHRVDEGQNRHPSDAAPSSVDILARLKERQDEMKGIPSTSAASSSVNKKTDYYASMMQDIRSYIIKQGGGGEKTDAPVLDGRERGGPTTQRLLLKFSSVPDRDAAIFKRLLKTIARVVGGRWQLKPQYLE